MPAESVVSTTSAVDVPALHPLVQINGQDQPLAHCLSIEQSTGISPGRAFIRLMSGTDATGPTTLGMAPAAFRYGSRVKVYSGDQTFFLGQIMRRSDRGQQDLTVWEALDDRIILENLFVRGCFVGEVKPPIDPLHPENSYKIKHIRRFVARTNPGGMWNCTILPVERPTGPPFWINVPVFTPYASKTRNYDTPDDDYSGQPATGIVLPWTPRRFLAYLWFLANCGTGYIVQGIIDSQWRSIYASTRIEWLPKSVTGMVGVDTSQGGKSIGGGNVGDPLDRKMPDMTFQGDRLLGAIEKTLKAAGTHNLRIDYGPDKSAIAFYPVGYSAVVAGSNSSLESIPLQRGGPANDVNTAFDFEMEDDASQVCEAVLVEGAPVRVETRIRYEDGSLLELEPAWTREAPATDTNEEKAFLAVIKGGDLTLNATYAMVPPYPNCATLSGGTDLDMSCWVPADGTGARPYALRNSNEAVAIARQFYPRVFRAFSIRPEGITTALAGYGGKYAATSFYPQLYHRRQIFPEQLQFMLLSKLAGDAQCNWLMNNCPIRIRVYSENTGSAEAWTEAQFGGGVRTTPDGLLWLDAIAESRDGQSDCLYDGSLYQNPATVKLKQKIHINLAFPMDHRVAAYAIKGASNFDADYVNGMGGFPLLYIDAPDGYHEHHQVNSYPSGTTYQWNGSVLTPEPMNRIVPPGSEERHAIYTAKRRLFSVSVPQRRTSWKMIGIRPEYRAGQWVSFVEVRGGPASDQNVLLNSPIDNVTFDFSMQETRLGGMIFQGMI